MISSSIEMLMPKLLMFLDAKFSLLQDYELSKLQYCDLLPELSYSSAFFLNSLWFTGVMKSKRLNIMNKIQQVTIDEENLHKKSGRPRIENNAVEENVH